MRKLILGLALLLASAPFALADPVIALKAARLFDGKSDTLLPDASVFVQDGKILLIASGLPIPVGYRKVDLGDATLLPGLIDAHTHATGEASENWTQGELDSIRQGVPEKAIRSTAYARRTLEAGFTTIRNLGASEFIDVGLRNAINAGVVIGPRILTAVYALGARGGHCDETGYPYMEFGYEPGIEHGIASGADQFRDAVRMQIKYGADVIKVCGTGGVLSLADDVDTPQLTQEEMDAIVQEAHRLRRKVAVHAHGASGAKVAIRAGADSIEHGSFLDDEALQMMKERGTALVPTFLAVHTVGRKAEAGLFPAEIAEKARAAAAAHGATLRKAIGMGIKIVFGTDSGVSVHGHNAEEFALMVDAGMTPASALRAATSSAAQLLGIDGQTGSLEVGKAADIIAVPGNPLEDIRQMEKVELVMKGGALIKTP